MARIEGIHIQNFRTLRDVTLGKLYTDDGNDPLTTISIAIGKNGTGKSTLFDAFVFLADCLQSGVEDACDMRGRGGFERILSQGQTDSINFGISYRENEETNILNYYLSISMGTSGHPYVQDEILSHSNGSPNQFVFLELENGIGEVVTDIEWNKVRDVELDDKRKLGIATLGALTQHPRVAAFRHFLENWHLSYFAPDAARGLPLVGPQRHLNTHGDNLANVVQYMEREHPDKFQSILDRISQRIPGIQKISTLKSPDGRLLLQFNDRGFTDPFYASQMSDGTLKLFAYMLLLEDPTPPTFLCIEEPENGLYHKLLETLMREFREHAYGRKDGAQIFITTHSPHLVDALTPEEVWILDKGEDGFAKITRASDDPLVKNLAAEGLPLGSLWYSDYLDAR